MSEEKKSGNLIAIITMFALYGMVGFVTNLAAPLGDVWKAQPGINGSNALGMMGNTMNFLAYLLMGIPAGRMIPRRFRIPPSRNPAMSRSRSSRRIPQTRRRKPSRTTM